MGRVGQAKFRVGAGGAPSRVPVPRHHFRHRPDLQQHRGMVAVDPRRGAPAQGPALLSPAGRERSTPSTSPTCPSRTCCPTPPGAPLRHPQVGELFALERRRQLPAAVPAAAALSIRPDVAEQEGRPQIRTASAMRRSSVSPTSSRGRRCCRRRGSRRLPRPLLLLLLLGQLLLALRDLLHQRPARLAVLLVVDGRAGIATARSR